MGTCVNFTLFFQKNADILEIGDDLIGHGGDLFSRKGAGVV